VRITAAIITLNEEKKIRRALNSVCWADEVLVVDSGSTDRTLEIARDCGARVEHRNWTGFSDQKQHATDLASNDWIFSLDADEAASHELSEEILELRSNGSSADGFRMPRLSFYMGREIRHSGWYPDRQLRLFNRTKARWKKVPVHESIQPDPDAAIVDLRHNIHHYSVDDAAHHHRMIGERYAPLAAKAMMEAGKRTSLARLVSAGPISFVKHYVLKGGYLDGLPGFTISKFAAHHAFLKHLMLWEMQTRDSTRPSERTATKE
jgi:glycosyltransferase involved in cell wall biosynthesis